MWKQVVLLRVHETSFHEDETELHIKSDVIRQCFLHKFVKTKNKAKTMQKLVRDCVIVCTFEGSSFSADSISLVQPLTLCISYSLYICWTIQSTTIY